MAVNFEQREQELMQRNRVLENRVTVQAEEVSIWKSAYAGVCEERDRLESALEEIQNWTRAYPLSIFPEPDFAAAAEALTAAGLSLDSVSASNMRHVIVRLADIVNKALESKP